jgi:signal transduction histidine kinase
MIFGSAIWLARVLLSWSRRIALLKDAVATADNGSVDLPRLPHTGEQELDRLVEALNTTGARLALERQRATAAERLAAVGRLSAGLAHEIRNPIAAMRLKAENALASGDGSRERAALEAILTQVARLDALLRDLLAMTQSGEPKYSDVNIAAFVQTTIETHRELAARKGLSLRAGTLQPHNPLPRFDPLQMQRALDNLILNAIQNTPPTGEIVVDALRCGDKLLFRVSDTGAGLEPAMRGRLFEPFATSRPGGTGLGLAAVREIARSHHGDARLADAACGATFEIEVPWRPS